MERDFGTPYMSSGLPYGTDGTMAWLSEIIEKLGAGELIRASHEAAKLKEFLLRKGNNLESLWGPLWFDAVLISAPPSEALGIAEAIRSEWIDTAHLCIHAQCETEKSTPAADAIRVVMKNEKEIAKDYEDWQGGLVLSSSHEDHSPASISHFRRMTRFIFPIFRSVAFAGQGISTSSCGMRS